MLITNVMAVSVDGRIASHANESDAERLALGFTNGDDFNHLLGLLKTTDAVIVGSSSLKASGRAFSCINDRGVYPIWATLTSRGLPPDQPFYQQAELTRWLVSPQPLQLPHHKGVLRNIVSGDLSPAQATVAALSAAGVERVLLFGGASVNREFYAADLVDRLIITICPLVLARSDAVPLIQPDLPSPVYLRLASSQVMGNLVILSYDLMKRATHGLTRSD
jgi:riboflavin biosynthesis pyrimidine reductase